MKRTEAWEFPSLKWIHRVRESQYLATRGLPLQAWLKPEDPDKAAEACRRLGLKVRIGRKSSRRRVRAG